MITGSLVLAQSSQSLWDTASWGEPHGFLDCSVPSLQLLVLSPAVPGLEHPCWVRKETFDVCEVSRTITSLEGPFVPTAFFVHRFGSAEPCVLELLPFLSGGNWGKDGRY